MNFDWVMSILAACVVTVAVTVAMGAIASMSANKTAYTILDSCAVAGKYKHHDEWIVCSADYKR